MNTLHLTYAVEIEKTKSITKAAKNLYMAQPNLSKAIKELEDSLGFSIFSRTSKGITPTTKGEVFLTYAKDILSNINKMEALSNTDVENLRSFNVCIPRVSYISYSFIELIKSICNDNKISIDIKETNSIKTISHVANNRYNLGIIRYDVRYEGYFNDFIRENKLFHKTIWTGNYHIVVSKNSPLAKHNKLNKNDLSNYIEIMHGDKGIPYFSSKNYKELNLENIDKKIFVYERASQFEALTHIENTYMWVSPIPKDYLKRHELVLLPCENTSIFKDVLVTKKGYEMSDLDNQFIDILQKNIEKLQEK